MRGVRRTLVRHRRIEPLSRGGHGRDGAQSCLHPLNGLDADTFTVTPAGGDLLTLQ